MTLNELITRCRDISCRLTSGDIPVAVNEESVDIRDITLERNDNSLYVNLHITKEP